MTPGKQLAVPGQQSSGPFSYSGDPSTSDLDAVRFLIGDTDPNAYFLNDAEIGYMLSLSAAMDSTGDGATPNIPAAAGAAAEAIAAELSREVSYSADGVSVSADTLANKYYGVAEKIRSLGRRTDIAAAPKLSGLMCAEGYDSSLKPLVFAVGMHDNYLAGQQDFGGNYQPPSSWDWQSGGYAPVAAEAAQLRGEAMSLSNVGNSMNP